MTSLYALLAAVGRWVAAYFGRRQADAAQDAASILWNREAAHAAQDAQAREPASRAALADSVRAGTDF